MAQEVQSLFLQRGKKMKVSQIFLVGVMILISNQGSASTSDVAATEGSVCCYAVAIDQSGKWGQACGNASLDYLKERAKDLCTSSTNGVPCIVLSCDAS